MKTMKRFAIPAMAVLFALAVMPVFAQNDQAPRNPNTMLENPGVGPNIPPAAEAGAQSEPPVPGRGRGMRDGRGMGQGPGLGRGRLAENVPGEGYGCDSCEGCEVKGMGQGRGMRGGRGMGQGQGRGMRGGRGMGQGQGYGRGMGQGQGYGRGARDGSGPGRGLGFGGGCDPDCPNAR